MKAKAKIKLVVSGLLLIVSLFSIFWVFGSFAIAHIFITGFEVSNETTGTIKVTPFGHYEGTNMSGPLPIFLTRFPAIDSPFKTNLKIEPKEKRRIMFDSDDTELNGIIILDNSGQYKQMPVKLEYRKNVFTINDSTALQPVGERLIQITTENYYLRYIILHALLLVGLLNIPYFFLALKEIP